MYKGVEELIKNGHKDIAIIEGAINFDSTKMRREGYLKAFNNYNIKLNKNLVLNGNFTVKSGYEKANELIEMNEKFSAIFAFNDEMATGAIKAITEHGLRVPEDISILGFDGNEIGRFITPSITTIKRPIGEIARIATGLLLRLLNNERDITTKKIYIESELELGNSIKDLN
ncbi:DNA-binding LacI/PurR family transcriptional regulator [Clostridium beijerinckii]|nr:DNA-binding LacI/PurR family transcriptional regulator [Clostridium beijerinckii]